MIAPEHRNQVATRLLSAAEVWDELQWLCAELQRRGHEKVLISFRFAWSAAMESEEGVIERHIAPEEIANHVRAMEASGDGTLGSDDFYLEVEEVEINLCHESDIHCWFHQPNDLVMTLYRHWQETGAEPKALTWCGDDSNCKPGAELWKPLALSP